MRRIAIGIGAALALSAGASLSAVPASGQGPVSTPFTTPGTTTFTVPAGICSVTVDVRGAQGGDATGVLSTDLKNKFQSQDGNSQPTDAEVAAAKARAADLGAQDDTGAGGLGGEATATLTVTPGEVLTITVGEAGGDIETKLPNGGAPDGGSGAVGEASGAGGGGSSDVRQGGSDLAHRVVVGGGGGGGGVGFFLFESLTEDGGGGGGLTGEKGDPTTPGNLFAGGGGTQSMGGAGGTLSFPFDGNAGDPGALGAGGDGGSDLIGGAGGGGGYYGGGGGAGSDLFAGEPIAAFGDPGGGGSGFGPAGTVFQTGVNHGDGSVVVTYDPDHTGCVVARFTG